MLGSKTPLALQASFKGKSYLEETMQSVLKDNISNYRTGKFREIICNDEVMWESMGIPMASLSRFPYPEYHSSRDNPSIISKASLQEAIDVLQKTVEKLEASTLIHKNFQGVIGVSHPDFQLYVDPGQFYNLTANNQNKLRDVMDLLPLMPSNFFAEQLANKIEISMPDLLNYLEKWQSKGLITII